MDFSLREPSERFSNKTSNLQSVFQSYCSSLQLSSVWPPLPVCLLRGLQGGISPNYLYWSGETGEYQTGRSSLSSSCFFSVRSLHPPLPAAKRRENTQEHLCKRDCFNRHHTLLQQPLQWFTVHIQVAVIKPAFLLLIFQRPPGERERLFFCLQSAVVLSPQHTNHCGGGKDTPLGPTLS